MAFAKRAALLIFLILVCADLLVFSWYILRRPVMTAEQWAFLEKQRPKVTVTGGGVTSEFFLCADCLDYALARRPISGWDASARLVETLNLPASLLARRVFEGRQMEGLGTSQGNSDLATLIFAAGALAEFAAIAALLSVRFKSRTREA